MKLIGVLNGKKDDETRLRWGSADNQDKKQNSKSASTSHQFSIGVDCRADWKFICSRSTCKSTAIRKTTTGIDCSKFDSRFASGAIL